MLSELGTRMVTFMIPAGIVDGFEFVGTEPWQTVLVGVSAPTITGEKAVAKKDAQITEDNTNETIRPFLKRDRM